MAALHGPRAQAPPLGPREARRAPGAVRGRGIGCRAVPGIPWLACRGPGCRACAAACRRRGKRGVSERDASTGTAANREFVRDVDSRPGPAGATAALPKLHTRIKLKNVIPAAAPCSCVQQQLQRSRHSKLLQAAQPKKLDDGGACGTGRRLCPLGAPRPAARENSEEPAYAPLLKWLKSHRGWAAGSDGWTANLAPRHHRHPP